MYDRIRRKSTIILPGASKPVMLPENFTSDQVPDSGKETCRNWFFKIASIRELIPRLYPSLSSLLLLLLLLVLLSLCLVFP